MATLTKKSKNVHLEFNVSTKYGYTDLVVDIDNKELIFRARGCRTECDIRKAREKYSNMSYSIIALVEGIYDYEVDALVRELEKDIY